MMTIHTCILSYFPEKKLHMRAYRSLKKKELMQLKGPRDHAKWTEKKDYLQIATVTVNEV